MTLELYYQTVIETAEKIQAEYTALTKAKSLEIAAQICAGHQTSLVSEATIQLSSQVSRVAETIGLAAGY